MIDPWLYTTYHLFDYLSTYVFIQINSICNDLMSERIHQDCHLLLGKINTKALSLDKKLQSFFNSAKDEVYLELDFPDLSRFMKHLSAKRVSRF